MPESQYTFLSAHSNRILYEYLCRWEPRFIPRYLGIANTDLNLCRSWCEDTRWTRTGKVLPRYPVGDVISSSRHDM